MTCISDRFKSGKKTAAKVFVVLFLVYVLSYLALSRIGYAEAEHQNSSAFYYFGSVVEDRDGAHNACVIIYWPLNRLDCALGTGRYPVRPTERLWSPTKRDRGTQREAKKEGAARF